MLIMVGLTAVVLVIAGAGSLILTRNAARNDAKQQLVSEADSLTSANSGTQSLRVLRVIQRTLKLEDANFLRVDRTGQIVSPLPDGLTPADFDVPALQAGETVSGRSGSLVYAAAPVTLSATERTRLHFQGTLAILLTRDVAGLGPSWSYFFLAGGAALVVAALVAWRVSRRMARPLEEAMEATGRIAAGDLESRVPVRHGDYPEFASLAGSINDMAQSLEDGRARERHLLLAVSHDLRTPLTSIRGFAEAIQDGAIDDNGKAADVIIAESRRLERLVGDLLDLTKLEAKQMSITMRATDPVEVVSTTVEGFRPAAAKSGLRLDVTTTGDTRARFAVEFAADPPEPGAVAAPPAPPPAALGPVAADPDRLAQLLANLLENAITFARSSVTVSVLDARGRCEISVDDDGPGIAPADLPRVFERFYRADRGPNRRLGSGLGLAIVAELVAAMGATVRAESPTQPVGGSRFVVTLQKWPGSAVTGSA
jgi:signal transduction histidine kinase